MTFMTFWVVYFMLLTIYILEAIILKLHFIEIKINILVKEVDLLGVI